MKETLTAGLAVISDGCGHQPHHQVEVRIAPLNEAIRKMQSLLSAYQIHEARELLCIDMARQVQRLNELKIEMESLLLLGESS